MSRVLLDVSATIYLNGAGTATLKLGPLTAREVWYPVNVHVNANSNPVSEATCIISVGDSNTRSFRDATFTGSSGDSTDKVNADRIKAGEYIWATWTGGDAGVQATLSVTGNKDI
jgi:hypothetical protein